MNDCTLIKYGAKSAVSRWFDSYWTARDRRAAPWALVSLLLGILFLGPQVLLWLASFLPLDQLGNSGASIHSHQVLLAVASILGATGAVIIVSPLLKPTFIETSSKGIRRVWSLGIFELRERMLPWSEVTSIQVLRPAGATDMRSYNLSLNTATSSSGLKLPLGELENDQSRESIVTAISRWATGATIEPGVFDALMPKRALSFTEIWLDALSAPPHRERLLPLSDGSLLDGRYRTINRLGGGGQGTVYLAEDTQEKKKVVLKETILPVYTDLISRRQALEDFHKEALALESVKHPNIVRFIGSFVADHRAYLVLDFVEGCTVKEMVARQGPLPASEANGIALQMCDILSVLHSLSPPLVHRDFTPDNLMIDSSGKLILLDFAVATTGDRTASDVAGKASYMAPEQFKGKPTIQSDIYSAGCTISYLLTAEHPDPLTESCPMLLNRDIPKELNDVVGKATRYDMSDRYPDAVALKSALQALL